MSTFLKNQNFDSYDHVILSLKLSNKMSNNEKIKPKIITFRNYSVVVDIFVANKHDNKKYSGSYPILAI